MKNYLLFIIILLLSGCVNPLDSSDPFVMWWNGTPSFSENELKAWSECLDQAKLKYPDSIDPIGEKQIQYEKECMNQKGY